MTTTPATTERLLEGGAVSATGDATQMITFTLGEEVYAVDIMSVREIKVWTETTPLPNTPEFVRGVINLRGVIVPIFDLRERFGQGRTVTTKTHVIIIIAVGDRTIGILVDAVSDIVTLHDSDLRPVPEAELGQESAFLSALATVNDKMVALIAPERLFSRDAVNSGADLAPEQIPDSAAE